MYIYIYIYIHNYIYIYIYIVLFVMRLAPVVQAYIALAVVCGMTALLSTLLLWPTRQMVFLDKACIEQTNFQTKTGIMSLGFFLRNSTETVVLWDESYVLSGFATALSQPTSCVVAVPRCRNSLATRVIATPRCLPPLSSPYPSPLTTPFLRCALRTRISDVFLGVNFNLPHCVANLRCKPAF